MRILTIFDCKMTLIAQIAGFRLLGLSFLALIDEEGIDYWWWDCWFNTCFVS